MTRLITIAWCLGIVLTSFGSHALEKKSDYTKWNDYPKWSEREKEYTIICPIIIDKEDEYKKWWYGW